MRVRNRLAQGHAAGRGRVANIAGAQAFDGPLEHRRRRLQFRIADAQDNDHVLAAQLRFARRVVNGPRLDAFAR